MTRAGDPSHPDHGLLVQVLDQLGGVRAALERLADRVGAMERAAAAHPDPDALRGAMERQRVAEAREEGLRTALAEARGDIKALTARVEALERSEARGGVTITGVHKVAAAGLGLITLALVALVGYLWRR